MPDQCFSKCRFIGYAIPTGPAQDQLILSKYLVGNYLGAVDVMQDLQARVQILKNAVDTAKAALPKGEDVTSVNNIFLAPEFFFHGNLGPYVFSEDKDDPAAIALGLLEETFNPTEYPNWTFVFGTMLTAKVADIEAVFQSPAVQARKNLVRNLALTAQAQFGAARNTTEQILSDTINDLRTNPALEVRDRAIVMSNPGLSIAGSGSSLRSMTSEKYYLSPIDFVLFGTNNENVVTEEMVAYPHIDLSGGDVKKHAFDKYAVFQQELGRDTQTKYLNFGIEICLDHDDARLRKNLGRQKAHGSDLEIQVQLVPSSGSAIVQQSVVAGANGFVFNCDGWCAFDSSSTPQQANIGGVECVYVNYASQQGNITYSAHTQLARVKQGAKGNDPNVGSASFQSLDQTDVVVVPVTEPSSVCGNLNQYFAGGSGAIHIYGANAPYSLES